MGPAFHPDLHTGWPSLLPPAQATPLTLQLLVPGLPLQVDGCCSVVDEALETGILALLHRHAGRLNGDDRTPEAWMESEDQILGSVG